MESTVSVSKGVFLFPNGFKKSKVSKKKSNNELFETLFKREPWYTTYKKSWDRIETEIEELQHRTYSILLNDMVDYVKSFYKGNGTEVIEGIVPSATLLTGVNQPDHASQFTALMSRIREEVTPHIAMTSSQDAPTIKHLVENTVWQLINGHEEMDISLNETDENMDKKKKLKKSQCTMKALQNWYITCYMNISPRKKQQGRKSLVIIIPDFESFNSNVLQDFVMIVSSYVPKLPIVFIFGVATSVSALHKSFPYHVSSKLLIKVFHSHSSPTYMNQILEEVFLTHRCPFQMTGKAFQLLTDVFLFYDFSVTGLIQSIKYCMMEHYYGDNVKALCCEQENLEKAIMNLSADDLEGIRQLMSFRPFLEVQDCETKIALFEDDDFFRDILHKEMIKLHEYLYSFYVCVRLLCAFVKELPRNVLGKTVREIYSKCVAEDIVETQAFNEAMQLLSFQSQVPLVESVKSALKVVNTSLQITSPIKPLRSTPTKNNLNNVSLKNDLGENFVKTARVHLMMFLRQIENANTEATALTNVDEDDDVDLENTPGSRYKLKEKLLKATRVERVQSEFSMVRARLVSWVREAARGGLRAPGRQTFHELLWFAAPAAVRPHLLGAPRAALHTALTDPRRYLQCSCCGLSSAESVVGSLPDVCVAYKLHRECGKHINLYDWLQAFAAVLKPEEPDDMRHQDPQVQARFTRAVSELQFLGFIKSSKRKTDHVMRLTW